MAKTSLDKLAQLESQDFAEDSKEILKSWRDELNRIEVDKAFASLKNTKEIIKSCDSRVFAINGKLLSERHLSVEDREYLLGAKDALMTLIFWLNPKNFENRKKSIEADIDANIEEKGD